MKQTNLTKEAKTTQGQRRAIIFAPLVLAFMAFETWIIWLSLQPVPLDEYGWQDFQSGEAIARSIVFAEVMAILIVAAILIMIKLVDYAIDWIKQGR